MDSTKLLERLEALAVRQGLSLGMMQTSGAGDFVLMMAAAGCAFSASDACSEREVNARLQSWLAGPGAMLAVDHVELRRWLVDNGVLARDGFGRVYTKGTPRSEIADAMACLAGHDLAALVSEARTRDVARREARKAQWTKTQGRGA